MLLKHFISRLQNLTRTVDARKDMQEKQAHCAFAYREYACFRNSFHIESMVHVGMFWTLAIAVAGVGRFQHFAEIQ